MTTVQQGGSASAQGALWSARPRDWSEHQEVVQRPLYIAVFDRIGVGSGMRLLDVGCGAGLGCQIAAERGAVVTGIDAAAALIEVARGRLPGGDFRVGEMEQLPFGDGAFDAVTGFNSFQYAARPVNALREARRVAQPGAPVIVMTWGEAHDCEAAAYIVALGRLLPPPPGSPGPFALSDRAALEALAGEASLTPVSVEDVDCPFVYPDLDAALRGLLAAGPAVRATQAAGEDAVRAAVTESLAPFRTAAGGYRLENRFRYLLATA